MTEREAPYIATDAECRELLIAIMVTLGKGEFPGIAMKVHDGAVYHIEVEPHPSSMTQTIRLRRR